MKTVYMTGSQWQKRALSAEMDRASGDTGSRIRDRDRRLAGDKVVDLAAWKAENLVELDGPETEPASALGQYGGREPVRRCRRSAALDRAELAATLGVIAAFAALIVRVLLF